MPTITLQDGTEVIISQESYDALAQAVTLRELTYQEVAEALFNYKYAYCIANTGNSIQGHTPFNYDLTRPNKAPTENQLVQLLALNKLFNVAHYLNEGWIPDWSNKGECKYYIVKFGEIIINSAKQEITTGTPYFKSKELAQRAIAILGEKAIKECFGIFE